MRYDMVIFDLDGTLYEDPRVYDRYARELSRFLPAGQRAAYLKDWRQARAGRGVARVGLGYDRGQDRLFRFTGDTISGFIDWDGSEVHAGDQAMQRNDVPLFGGDRVFIGDHWGLPETLAIHYGVAQADRAGAFLSTRAWMSSEKYTLATTPELHATLAALAAAGARLAALSNSPVDTVDDVLRRLGVRDLFATIAASSNKPAGLLRFLQEHGAGERVLCVGDHYVNEIAPALLLGCHALYIDRHHTGLGTGSPNCTHVESIGEALDWLRTLAAADDRRSR
ncbi:MAG TPA: HAD family hydrolase [Chloroflexota bacterium]|nr:HAD family hydrolase [Chloroflexota bacterium]